jgi:hypothetical protein
MTAVMRIVFIAVNPASDARDYYRRGQRRRRSYSFEYDRSSHRHRYLPCCAMQPYQQPWPGRRDPARGESSRARESESSEKDGEKDDSAHSMPERHKLLPGAGLASRAIAALDESLQYLPCCAMQPYQQPWPGRRDPARGESSRARESDY